MINMDEEKNERDKAWERFHFCLTNEDHYQKNLHVLRSTLRISNEEYLHLWTEGYVNHLGLNTEEDHLQFIASEGWCIYLALEGRKVVYLAYSGYKPNKVVQYSAEDIAQKFRHHFASENIDSNRLKKYFYYVLMKPLGLYLATMQLKNLEERLD